MARLTAEPNGDRLGSWKAIARYLDRDVRTVQRWERDEALPVHRHQHKRRATVYAYKGEIDAWRSSRVDTVADGPGARAGSPTVLWVLIAGLALAGIIAFWIQADSGVDKPTPLPETQRERIIILPFDDQRGPPHDLLADALTEKLATQIAALAPESLAVIARLTASQYKDRQPDIEELRNVLGVAFVLDGTVGSGSNGPRVTAQLIDTASNAVTWSGTLEYESGDWSATHREAALYILDGVGPALQLKDSALLQDDTVDASAYERTLLGLHYFDHWGAATLPQAISHFEAAIEQAPEYAEPRLGLALSHAARAFFGAAPAAESYREVDKWASSALEFDPDNGLAVALLGWVDFVYRWDWAEAERKMRHGVAMAPDSPWTHFLLGNMLTALKRPEEAIAEADAALFLDPASPYTLQLRGMALNHAGRHEEALQHWCQVRDRMGEGAFFGFVRNAYVNAGDFDAAVDEWRRFDPTLASDLERSLAAEGEQGYWRTVDEYYRRSEFYFERTGRSPFEFSQGGAIAAAQAGDSDYAIEMLRRGYYQRHPAMVYLPVYPLEPLYDDPRFIELVRDMGFPPDTMPELADY